MTVRPALEEETVERLNEEVERHLPVPPESISFDERLKIVLDQLGNERAKRQTAERRMQNQQAGGSQY